MTGPGTVTPLPGRDTITVTAPWALLASLVSQGRPWEKVRRRDRYEPLEDGQT